MKSSIRAFLLLYLLLSVTIITSIAFMGNLYQAHQDIQAELDAQLTRTSLRMKAFFDRNITAKELSTIQNNITAIAQSKASKAENISPLNKTTQRMESALEFQVWDNKNRKLLLQSAGAPKQALVIIGKTTLKNKEVGNNHWRVKSIVLPKQKITIMVANREDYRQHLENQMTNHSIFILLITFPFLGLLIWFIVGKALSSISIVTNEVRHRAASYLEPVNMSAVPSEISPLVSELNKLFTRLKKAFERHERFTSDAAHELKTPLAALSAHTQVALRAETPQDRNEALLKVLGGVNRCTHVVQQLLTFSRMCPEAGLSAPTEVNVTTQAIEVAAMLAPEAIAKNVELELTNPECKPIMTGNPTAIGILIRNLVDNAIRYSEEDSYVKINISEQKDVLTIRVIDNGPGIPEELRDRVFERFFRVIGNKSPGSGLGLGIAQQIVKLHKGNIELLTAPGGKGLEIKITLPKKHE
jgi:two-component system, OmpR family, sensor histidine kinase QseC